MSLLLYATELVNESKLCTEIEETLFKLEQIKEIVLNRDMTILPLLYNNIIELRTHNSIKIKKFLIKFSSDAICKNSIIVNDFLLLFNHLFDDNNEHIQRLIILNLTKLYDKIAMAIVNLNTNKNFNNNNNNNNNNIIITIWDSLQLLINKCIEKISTINIINNIDNNNNNNNTNLIGNINNEEHIKLEILKLIESVIYFGFPSSERIDNNLHKYSKYSLNDIPIDHVYINKELIEKDTEALFKKLLIWLSRQIAGNIHLSVSILYSLAILISKIVVERPSSTRILDATKALTSFIISLNDNVEMSLDLISCDLLSQKIKLILSIALGDGNYTNTLTEDYIHYEKLKQVLSIYDNKTESRKVTTVVSDPRKRGRMSNIKTIPITNTATTTTIINNINNLEELNDDIDISEKVHESAVATIDMMEAKLKQNNTNNNNLNNISLITSTTTNNNNNNQKNINLSITNINSIKNNINNQNTILFGWDILKDTIGTTIVLPQDITQHKLITLQLLNQSDITLKTIPNMINVIENQYQNIALYNLENYITQLLEFKLPKCYWLKKTDKLNEEEIKIKQLLNSFGIKLSLSLCEIITLALKSNNCDLTIDTIIALHNKNNKMFSNICIYYISGSIHSYLLDYSLFQNNLFQNIHNNNNDNNNSYTNTFIYLSKMFQSIPYNINIPKPIWLLVSMFLTQAESIVHADYTQATNAMEISMQLHSSNQNNKKKLAYLESTKNKIVENISSSETVAAWILMLLQLVKTIYQREEDWKIFMNNDIENEKILINDECNNNNNNNNSDSNEDTLYDQICLLIISRLMQRRSLRAQTNYFIDNLDIIPLNCIKYLIMVLYFGGKLYDNENDTNDKSIRQLGSNILGQIIINYYQYSLKLKKENQIIYNTINNKAYNNIMILLQNNKKIKDYNDIIRLSLYSLLYCTISSSEIDVRSIVTTTIMNTIIPNINPTCWIIRTIYIFSIQSTIGLIGCNKFNERVIQQYEQYPLKDTIPEYLEDEYFNNDENEINNIENIDNIDMNNESNIDNNNNDNESNNKNNNDMDIDIIEVKNENIIIKREEIKENGSITASNLTSVLLLDEVEEDEENEDENGVVHLNKNESILNKDNFNNFNFNNSNNNEEIDEYFKNENEHENEINIIENKEDDIYIYEGLELQYNNLLYQSITNYDMGLSYYIGGGPFTIINWNELISILLLKSDKIIEIQSLLEQYTRIHFHLLFQLCLIDINMLIPILNIYGNIMYWKQQLEFELVILKNNNNNNEIIDDVNVKKLELNIQCYDIILHSIMTIFESTIGAALQKHYYQHILPNINKIVNKNELETDNDSDIKDKNTTFNSIELLIHDLLLNTDIFAFPLLFIILDTIFNVDTNIIGSKKMNINVTDNIIQYFNEYINKINIILLNNNEQLIDITANKENKDNEYNEYNEENNSIKKKQKIDNNNNNNNNDKWFLLPLIASSSFLQIFMATIPTNKQIIEAITIFTTKFQTTIINGYTQNELKNIILPNILRYFPPPIKSNIIKDTNIITLESTRLNFYSSDTIKKVFSRLIHNTSTLNINKNTTSTINITKTDITTTNVIKSISKVELLLYLHQFDYEKYNEILISEYGNTIIELKLSSLLESISICLDQLRDDYTSDIINQVLLQLIAVPIDNVLEITQLITPPILMRTAILAGTKYDDCKKIVFSQIIPVLIRRESWHTAPKIWDGVAYFTKKFATTSSNISKDIEITLRTLLGMPLEPLKKFIESLYIEIDNPDKKSSIKKIKTNDLIKLIKKLLIALSPQEKNEVFSGIWANSNINTKEEKEEKEKYICNL